MQPLPIACAALLAVFDVKGSRASAMEFCSHVQRSSRQFYRPSFGTQLNGIRLVGGHYIGLCATFDSLTGKHIPIDERYIPSSLMEWGHPPTTLEELVSETTTALNLEEWVQEYNARRPSTSINLTRDIFKIMPATGCDVDNLNTIHTKEEWKSARIFCHEEHGPDMYVAASTISVVGNRANADLIIRLESCFGWTLCDNVHSHWKSPVFDSTPSAGKIQSDINQYRTRISVDLRVGYNLPAGYEDTGSVPIGWKIVSPIRVSLERKMLSSMDSVAVFPHKGGLDALTVANWLGPTLNREQMRNFPVDYKFANCSWAPHESRNFAEHHSCAKVLFLAGNLTVCLQNQEADIDYQCQFDIGHLIGPTSTEKDFPFWRHLVSFHLPSSNRYLRSVGSNHIDFLSSCMVTSRLERGTVLYS